MMKETEECQQRFHVDAHDRYNDKVWCDNCKALVIKDGINCPCCGYKIKRKKQYKLLKIVLNNTTKNNEDLIKAWISKPNPNRVSLFTKWKYVTYEIPIVIAALYYDTTETGTLPEWTYKIFTKAHITEIKTDKYEYLNKRIRAIGLF